MISCLPTRRTTAAGLPRSEEKPSSKNAIQRLKTVKFPNKKQSSKRVGIFLTYEDSGGEGVRGAAVGEGVECDLGGGVLGLAECGAVVGALEGVAVEVDD